MHIAVLLLQVTLYGVEGRVSGRRYTSGSGCVPFSDTTLSHTKGVDSVLSYTPHRTKGLERK